MVSARCSQRKRITVHARSPVAHQLSRRREVEDVAVMPRTAGSPALAMVAVLSLMMSADIARERDIGRISVCDERKMKKGKTYVVDLLTPQSATCRILEPT